MLFASSPPARVHRPWHRRARCSTAQAAGISIWRRAVIWMRPAGGRGGRGGLVWVHTSGTRLRSLHNAPFGRFSPTSAAAIRALVGRRTGHAAEHAGALSAVAAREHDMAFQQQREDHAGDTSRCAALLCTALRPPHARASTARLGTVLRTPSMLGPSSVARLRRTRAEFRQNRRETDATKLQKMLSEASAAAMWKSSSANPPSSTPRQRDHAQGSRLASAKLLIRSGWPATAVMVSTS
jgi:hypothetical protein